MTKAATLTQFSSYRYAFSSLEIVAAVDFLLNQILKFAAQLPTLYYNYAYDTTSAQL